MGQNQIPAPSSGNNTCPVCHGRGYIFWTEDRDENNPGYGYATDCPECKGQKFLKEATGIPLEFAEADLNKFDFNLYSCGMERFAKVVWAFFEKFEQCEKEGKGFYFWSRTPGTGKTFLACALVNSLVLRYKRQMRFVTAPDYLAAVGNSINRQHGSPDGSEAYRKCSLLVLDDLGSQKSGEWQEQEIFRLIDGRITTGKLTIFTSNMPPEKLNLNPRTVDRIRRSSIVLQMPEESIRLRKAEEEQTRFLREVLEQ